MKFKAELKNTQQIRQARLEQDFYCWNIVFGCVATLLAGFLVGAIFTAIFFALPSSMSGVASLYLMCVSIIFHLLGFVFCLIFRIKKLQSLIIPLFGIIGIILLMPFYRCLILNQCDIVANTFVIYEIFGFPFQFFAVIYIISFATVFSVTSTYYWIMNYQNDLTIQKFNF